jgi:hypothetical protein
MAAIIVLATLLIVSGAKKIAAPSPAISSRHEQWDHLEVPAQVLSTRVEVQMAKMDRHADALL